MKTLSDFNHIKDFLASQGIQPTLGMLCVSSSEWADLVGLAAEWHCDREVELAEFEALSEDEQKQRLRDSETRRVQEQESLLFHSSGHVPGSE